MASHPLPDQQDRPWCPPEAHSSEDRAALRNGGESLQGQGSLVYLRRRAGERLKRRTGGLRGGIFSVQKSGGWA